MAAFFICIIKIIWPQRTQSSQSKIIQIWFYPSYTKQVKLKK